MAKIDLDSVARALSGRVDEPIVNEVLQDLKAELQEEAQAKEAEKEPKEKKQFCVLVSDPSGVLAGQDLVAWVAQIEESASPHVVFERIKRAAYEFNQSKKGRKHPVKTVGESCEGVGGKFFKEQKIAIKTKEPVLVVATDGVIPWNDRRQDD